MSHVKKMSFLLVEFDTKETCMLCFAYLSMELPSANSLFLYALPSMPSGVWI